MIKLIGLNGRVLDTDYHSFAIEDGDRYYCQGDQVWMNNIEMEISDFVDEDVLLETLREFDSNSAKTIKGYLRRVGVI